MNLSFEAFLLRLVREGINPEKSVYYKFEGAGSDTMYRKIVSLDSVLKVDYMVANSNRLVTTLKPSGEGNGWWDLDNPIGYFPGGSRIVSSRVERVLEEGDLAPKKALILGLGD